MNDEFRVIAQRCDFSKKRLAEIRTRIDKFEVLNDRPCLCIYVTGSFGRLEASKYSDLDIFFIHEGSSCHSCSMPRIKKTLLDADLIRAAQELRFPDFSNDGEYLEVHYIDDILNNLGGPRDDFQNHFTARLLLLLESRPLYNESFYENVMKKIIYSYYRDYHDHEDSFSPIFLINDIIRFWRTLCLNYEHRRNRLPDDNELKKNKNHLANLKLKFSRLVTCYATIILISINQSISPEDLVKTFKLSPFDRLDEVAEHVPETKEQVKNIKRAYSWFLKKTDQEKSEILDWIGDPKNRQDAFAKGRRFGIQIYELLLTAIKEPNAMRFLVV